MHYVSKTQGILHLDTVSRKLHCIIPLSPAFRSIATYGWRTAGFWRELIMFLVMGVEGCVEGECLLL